MRGVVLYYVPGSFEAYPRRDVTTRDPGPPYAYPSQQAVFQTTSRRAVFRRLIFNTIAALCLGFANIIYNPADDLLTNRLPFLNAAGSINNREYVIQEIAALGCIICWVTIDPI
jgi:hypothetical protein